MAEEPDWAKVLQELYRGQLAADVHPTQPTKLLELQGPLTENTELTIDEVESGLDFLDKVGLAEKFDMDEEVLGGLTPRGFEVAHEREIAKRQDRTNRGLVLVTAVLGLSALLGLMPTTFSLPAVLDKVAVVVLVVSLVGVLGLLIGQYIRLL